MTNANSPQSVPSSWRKRIKLMGPGLIAAATGVGAGDLVAALVAGTQFGFLLLWAIIIGSIIKYYLNEGVGRWQLATGKTILQGWNSLGRWTLIYFGIYIILWGFVYGAAGTSSASLATTAMFPQLDLKAWAILHGVIAFLLVLSGRYQLFERVMTVLTGLMFITVVGTAIIVFPHVFDLLSGVIPRIPTGSIMFVLGLIGGVGGSITIASYGYWIREKNWVGPIWLSFMRLDAKVAYILTAIFTISLLIVGAEFLYGTGIIIQDEKGLIQLSQLLGERFGEIVRWLFLLGFWSASFTSVLGVWNGVPYLFADFIRHLRKKTWSHNQPITEKDPAYRTYLVWLTFPPMLLLFLGKPVGLIIIYGVLGALFMPFLAITLLWLLNSKQVEKSYQNTLATNTILILSCILFIILAGQEIVKIIFK
ncbi:Nramp family divalent metal transporter [Thermoflavimicrobium daqui]|uniref:Iron transporter n=1 Tax=Thermoflavimicrobium daqui TaxID=2137476 RepID=A0A364K9L4_9BACL|nr:Nramp family divalent metal transporter [Thermoflavimicrobium daqui]RAL26989.1 iron transporter [Thermoflavimicrobium daqui]